MKKTHPASLFAKTKASFAAHKILTAVIAVTVIVGGYEIYHAKVNQASNVPQYTLAAAHIGNLMQTVSGTGQVSASNQTDIQSQVSGTIESIKVSVGQSVHTGDLIATIDPTNALTSLQSAQLSLAKLTEPAKETDLSNAQNSVISSYSNAFDAASTAYLDLPNIMAGMKDMLSGQTGFLSDQRSSYLSPIAASYRNTAGQAFDRATLQYADSFNEFKSLTRASATSSLVQMYADTYATMKTVADAASKVQTAIAYITDTAPDYDTKDAVTATTDANGWSSQANSDTSALLSAQNSITSSVNAVDNLVAGPDSYDLQSAQSSLDQAQRTYAEYFIRAPYDGIIGRIPVNVYAQAGGSTVIATIVGAQKMASISLNEVDAAKVAVGQNVNITFDAIDGLNATGTVSEVDQIGTVSSGVVSYGVKILINTQDARIKPGMSVNTSIITKEDDNVLLVPSTAVKTLPAQAGQANRSYVQILNQSASGSAAAAGAQTATGTRRFAGRTGTASTTSAGGYAVGSTTRTFSGTSGATAFGATTRTTTVGSAVPPQNIPVTTGDSDDTNTVILSGLTPGELVVTRVSTGGAAAATAAPSLLQSIGGNRTGGAAAGGANRNFGGGGAVRIGG